MVKPSTLLQRLLDGQRAIAFRDFERILLALGFTHERTKGSHRIYVHPAICRPFPVQPEGKDAKRYQIRELLELVEAYGLHIGA
ncbi:MAG: type II toxin-antitoxin system HicA family toxin [Sphingomonas sp.]|nr:type II toxin-antitoxin system HicA family toxin [Sphingomonas sp.]